MMLTLHRHSVLYKCGCKSYLGHDEYWTHTYNPSATCPEHGLPIAKVQ